MRDQPSSPQPSTAEQILDLLLAALQERQAARQTPQERLGEAATPQLVPTPSPGVGPDEALPVPEPQGETAPSSEGAPAPSPQKQTPISHRKPLREPGPGEAGWTPPPRLPGINLGRTLGRLLLVLLVLTVLVNVPINRHGTSLARIMPDSSALVIRDGLVLKGSSPEIYVLEDDKLRWISSLEAFEFYGYHWDQVHVVEDSFLEEFERGKPIHVLLKCQASPHIYALENGHKRWIKDIPTFVAEGYIWDDVKMVECSYLRRLPDGPSIPTDAGPSPQP